MPYPVSVAHVDEEEKRVGRRFPDGLRERLVRSNGGEVSIGDESWTLYSVLDRGSKRRTGRSANHIARETVRLHAALEDVLPRDHVAIGQNDAGDYLMLDPSSSPVIWRHEERTVEAVQPDWEGTAPRPRRRSTRSDAVERIAAALATLEAEPSTWVVVEAPDTRRYVQFRRTDAGFAGEAVGEVNLTKLDVFHTGARLRAVLPTLGWAAPTDPAVDAGNWTRTWSVAGWDPEAVARLAVRTLDEAYGLLPWALTVTLGGP